jgi:hypothetical protein
MRGFRSIPAMASVLLVAIFGALALITPLSVGVTAVRPLPLATTVPPQVVLPPSSVAHVQTCLSPKPRHDYAGHKFDKRRAGPGTTYKESKNAQGPSAVPIGMAALTPKERVEAVKTTYIQRLCGGKKFGGDKKLFQLGLLASDTRFLTAAPTHRFMNPNSTISRAEWIQGLDAYLATIRWDKTYVAHEKLRGEIWTTLMVTRPGKEPLVKAVRHDQPKSWYVYMAMTQPDGSLVYQRKRLACNFQDTYNNERDVPAILKV